MRLLETLTSRRSAKRRAWLRTVLGLAGALWLGNIRQARGPAPEALALTDWLKTVGPGAFGDHDALRHVGALYLGSHPQEADLGQLWRMVTQGAAASIEQRMLERIARDWREHDVTVIAGWVFARTEARFCAAVHLSGEPR